MAKVFTPIDGCLIMKSLVEQATGQSNIGTVTATNYVSLGERVMSTGMENVYNALSMVIGRTIVAARPYSAKLMNFQSIDTNMYTNRLRKISYYSKDPDHSGFFNTDLYTNLADGFTNGQNPDSNDNPQSLKSMWEQKQGMPVEVNFGGSTVWDYGITMYEDQVKNAFRSPDEMSRFIGGILTEHYNDIESGKEAYNRLALVSHIGSTYNLGTAGVSPFTTMAVNLTDEFNTKFGTSYTSAQLRTTYLKEFLAFMVVRISQISRYMTERSAHFHNPLTKTVNGVSYSVLRHTPGSSQKIMLYEPLFLESKAYVLPEIFHDERLIVKENYEGVDFWQSNYSDTVRPQIDITVPTLNASGVQNGTATVQLDYVVGIIFDRDALMVDYQLERALTTPIEARKGYRNTWLHIARNIISDQTENSVVLYMADRQ